VVLLAVLSVPLRVGAEAPFQVGLWGGSSAERMEEVRRGLLEAVGEELQSAGFSSIEVMSTADYDRRFEDLSQGRFALLETEPATYFLARRRWLAYDPQRWQYELAFQKLSSVTEPSSLRGTIISRSQSGLKSARDLRGKILGILSPYGLADGGIQLYALKRLGLERGQQLRVVQADSERGLCKALFSGLVDAIALPEGRAEAFLAEESAVYLRSDRLTVLYQSNLLPGPVWSIHRRLVEDHPDLVAQLRQRLPEAWPGETLLATREAYYVTTTEWVENLEGP